MILKNLVKKLCSCFEESGGKVSLMRLQSFLTLLFSFAIIIYQLWMSKVYIELDILLVSAAFLPKSIQKYAEHQINIKKENYE